MVVVRKISDLLFEVKGAPKAKTKILHHDRLKLFCGQSIPQWVMSIQRDLKVGSFAQSQAQDLTSVRKKSQHTLTKNGTPDVTQMLGSVVESGKINQPQRLVLQ